MQDRNAESHFGHVETTDIKRSMFNMPFRNLSTCNAGDIIPFMAYSDILPGDTVKCETSAVIRMQTPLNPTMDDAFVDIYYFAIPKRILWTHWAEFMGESKDSAWTTSTVYQEPQFTAPSGGVATGTIADYMGIPKYVDNIKYSELPFRAYVLTYNNFFRRQNLIAPATEYMDDTDRTGNNTTTELGGAPFKASKIADYFVTCNPEPSKPLAGMSQATIPLGVSAPVLIGQAHQNQSMLEHGDYLTWSYTHSSHNPIDSVVGTNVLSVVSSATNLWAGQGGSATANGQVAPDNLYADLQNATAATINALRLYFQIQKLAERRATHGSRLFEVLRSEFGVSPSMAVLQLPEYLGGFREPLNITQTVQTSATLSNTQELGGTGGMSHTTFSNHGFTKSFQEHSVLLGLLIVRQYHTYQANLHRMWTRRDKLDYYTPILAHLGEQPVYKYELDARGTSSDNDVFGYQERWAEYKYGQQIITGQMNSNYATPTDNWHYGDKYLSQPTLAQNWVQETPEYIDRTIGVKSTSGKHQFLFDIVSNCIFTRPMPVYCTPGLIDHF